MIDRVARATERYPYKVWGFGESIAMEALLACDSTFARDLLHRWARDAKPLASDPLAHVAPGVPLLDLYAQTGDRLLLERARELGHMLASAPVGARDARIHRPDLAGWEHEVWVDCMHLDAPFLVRLATLDSSRDWGSLGIELLLSHARVLQDERSGLFSHGFDDVTGHPNGVFWGRGQGWALLGLVDSLQIGHTEIRQRLGALVDGLARHEVRDGRWHTVVDASETYVEPSVGAFVALGVGKAVARGLVSPTYAALVQRARNATRDHIDEEGRLMGVSDATPVGADAAHYAGRPVGWFAWGQGPALLALMQSVERV